jgi:hypothetical protein
MSHASPIENGESKKEVATQEKEHSIMSWTLLAFNFITRFLWAYDAKLE